MVVPIYLDFFLILVRNKILEINKIKYWKNYTKYLQYFTQK